MSFSIIIIIIVGLSLVILAQVPTIREESHKETINVFIASISTRTNTGDET